MSGDSGTRGKWTLILGGARSGKSALAERLAREGGGPDVLFVATGQALDGEMRRRIQRHREDRAALGWRTLEAPDRVGPRLAETLTGREKVVIVDCLTLWVSNLLCGLDEKTAANEGEAKAVEEIDGLLAVLRNRPVRLIAVSNEVGLGVVPATPLGRLYRDALGRANQKMAAASDEVLFMVAGLQIRMKG